MISKSHRITLIGLSVGLAVFVGLTIKDSIIYNYAFKAGQESALVVSTNHECQGPEDSDTATVLLVKLANCRAQLEELTQQAHDEFDMD